MTRWKQARWALRERLGSQDPQTRHWLRASTLLLVLLLASAPVWAGLKAAVWADSVVHLQTLDSVAELWSNAEPEHHQVGATPAVDVECASDRPVFGPEVQQLRQALGDGIIGEPRECPHVDNATGDQIQVTTTGLVAFHQSRGKVMFTDGYRHWALDDGGLKYWEGDSSEPGA